MRQVLTESLSCPGWTQTCCPPASASQSSRITDRCFHARQEYFFMSLDWFYFSFFNLEIIAGYLMFVLPRRGCFDPTCAPSCLLLRSLLAVFVLDLATKCCVSAFPLAFPSRSWVGDLITLGGKHTLYDLPSSISFSLNVRWIYIIAVGSSDPGRN